ncbi:MAG: hypothetical protein ACFFC7_25745 [Candidatus Hermodarchaeota archaeon]
MAERELLLKALSNQKRREIFRFIQEHKIVIKNELIKHFEMHRAGLDHHLELLINAGLIETQEVTIKNKKYVFAFAIADFQLTITPLETAQMKEIIPQELSVETFERLSEELWLSEDIKDPIIKEKLLISISEKLELEPRLFFCHVCRNQPGIMKCSRCSDLVCSDCAEIIEKREPGVEQGRVILCLNCIANQFS